MQSTYTFEFINDQLLNFGAVHSAAELHGLLSGIISTDGVPDPREWPDIAIEFLDLQDMHLDAEQRRLFDDLRTQAADTFADPHLVFAPLLPSDSAHLARRAEELGAWCSGFLHGAGRALKASGEAALAPEVVEALRDIANISQAAVDEGEENEENETYWSELVEYVKVAVLTIHSEYQNRPEESTVH